MKLDPHKACGWNVLFILKIERFEMGHFLWSSQNGTVIPYVRLEGVFINFYEKGSGVFFLEIMCSLMHNS